MSEFEPEFIHEASDQRLIAELASRSSFSAAAAKKLLNKIPIKLLLEAAFNRKGFRLDYFIEQLNANDKLAFILSSRNGRKTPETWLRGDRKEVLRLLKEIVEEIEHEHGE